MKKLLVANRGEIARRIFRTARKMGIETVAVYSSADTESPFVREADEALLLGPSEANVSYLDQEKIIAAAHQTGADAIHPGYGFLSENAHFAKRVKQEGLFFIGPSAETIALLGDKVESRLLADNLKIPTVPGATLSGTELSKEALEEVVLRVGFPLIVKAAGGGGGRGMRIVRQQQELASALQRASAEAKSFFSDERVFVERYVEGARHVEIQFLGDELGNTFILSERDCSLQRNHQKVIEEAPAAILTQSQREALHTAARQLAQAVNYANAGTAEFLVSLTGDYYFLEVNSRLQVEHPVTECILGVDLVEAQIRVARGEDLSSFFAGRKPQGHAIELRLCAESPMKEFQASTGTVSVCNLDSVSEQQQARIDSGIEKGSVVSHYYDSLIAKIIVHRATREEAIEAARRVLLSVEIGPNETNGGLLCALLEEPSFVANTHSLQTLADVLETYRNERYSQHLAAHIACLWRAKESAILGQSLVGFTNTSLPPLQQALQINGELIQLKVDASWIGGHLEIRTERDEELFHSTLLSEKEGLLSIITNGSPSFARCCSMSNNSLIFHRGTTYSVVSDELFVSGKNKSRSSSSGEIRSPLPGKILEVCFEQGGSVSEDSVIIRLESMKMEHPIKAKISGALEEIHVSAGDSVSAGELLAKIS